LVELEQLEEEVITAHSRGLSWQFLGETGKPVIITLSRSKPGSFPRAGLTQHCLIQLAQYITEFLMFASFQRPHYFKYVCIF